MSFMTRQILKKLTDDLSRWGNLHSKLEVTTWKVPSTGRYALKASENRVVPLKMWFPRSRWQFALGSTSVVAVQQQLNKGSGSLGCLADRQERHLKNSRLQDVSNIFQDLFVFPRFFFHHHMHFCSRAVCIPFLSLISLYRRGIRVRHAFHQETR